MESQSPQSPHATHELVRLTKGDMSLRHIASGEVMHSNVGPREEARLLYVEQSRLDERLREAGGELVIWDVGLGAATNALAALQCWKRVCESGAAARHLRIVSFESDISGIRLALENIEHLPYFEGFEDAVQTLVDRREWSAPGVNWVLHEGDFRETAREATRPEVVFFDFYSPRTSPNLWDVSTFQLVRSRCSDECALYTYSASTRVRVALLLAGFFVGYGRSTGMKNDTTVAATRRELLDNPLDARWIDRFKRSEKRLPHGWPAERAAELEKSVLSHAQFL